MRTDPKAINKMLASDPQIVDFLASVVELQNRPPGKEVSKPITSKAAVTKPTSSTAPSAKAPNAKPPPAKTKEGIAMKRSTTAPKAPKRPRVLITAIDDPPPTLPIAERLNGRVVYEEPRPTTNAREVDEACPCRVCGGGVEVSGSTWGIWRQHRECSSLSSSSQARLIAAASTLGVADVDHELASLTHLRVPNYLDVHHEPTWTDRDRARNRGPWAHVDRKQLVAALSEAMAERDELSIPRPCLDGRCAWCGIQESLDWRAYGHKWPDGSEAPLCVDCAEVYERRGWPSTQFWDDQRNAIAETITRMAGSLGEEQPNALKAFAEVDADRGDGRPWSHLDAEALERFRWARWTLYGGFHAPIEVKDEAIARAQDEDAQKAEQTAAQVDADPFGFLGSEVSDDD